MPNMDISTGRAGATGPVLLIIICLQRVRKQSGDQLAS